MSDLLHVCMAGWALNAILAFGYWHLDLFADDADDLKWFFFAVCLIPFFPYILSGIGLLFMDEE